MQRTTANPVGHQWAETETRARVRALAREDAGAALSWLDPLTVAEAQGIDDGDGATLDGLDPCNLCPVGETLARAVDLSDLSEDETARLFDCYAEAFYAEWSDVLGAQAGAVLQEAAAMAEAARFSIGDTVTDGRGMAYTVTRLPSPDADDYGAVMVGDDYEWSLDETDLAPVDDGDYCRGCGQIGCGWA